MTKLIEYQGQRYMSRELAAIAGIPAVVFKRRMERGWTLTEAMTLPVDQRKPRNRKKAKP